MSDASLMHERPPVKMICYVDSNGSPFEYAVGNRGVTEIKEVAEYGEFCPIPWIEVWSGTQLLARFSQHKLEHIFYV